MTAVARAPLLDREARRGLLVLSPTLLFALAVSIIPMASGLNNVEGGTSRETAALQGLVRMFGVLLLLEALSLVGNYI